MKYIMQVYPIIKSLIRLNIFPCISYVKIVHNYMCWTVLNIEFLFTNTIFNKEILNMYVSIFSFEVVSSVIFHIYFALIILENNIR